MAGRKPIVKPARKPQAVADTSGMDPEMAKTLSQEVGRVNRARTMYSPFGSLGKKPKKKG